MSTTDPVAPVEGVAFHRSAGKALYGVFGGLFLGLMGAIVVAWRFDLFAIGNRRPTLVMTLLGVLVGGAGGVWALISFVQMFRKGRVVVGTDRVQIVSTSGGEDVVVAQVLFANVIELLFVKDDAGKRIGVSLADRDAEGTFAQGNTIRPWDTREGFSFVIEDKYEGQIEELISAIDKALSEWRDAQPAGPNKVQPWLR